MKYMKIEEGQFISRPNRFVAEVVINGKLEKVHVKNTGRCKELLVKGAKVYLEDFKGRMGTRKMRYSLVSVIKMDTLINMDSQAPNKVVIEALKNGKLLLPDFGDIEYIKAEQVYGNSRFDVYLENKKGEKAFLEVKGVTLEENGVAMFPDAPTLRGLKHVKELEKAKEEGYRAYIMLLIQMKNVYKFTPNYATHREFGEELYIAEKKGVKILAYDCNVTPETIEMSEEIPIVYNI